MDVWMGLIVAAQLTTLCTSTVTIWQDSFGSSSTLSGWTTTGSGVSEIQQLPTCPTDKIPAECLVLQSAGSDIQMDTTVNTTGYTELSLIYSFRVINGSDVTDYCSLQVLNHSDVTLYSYNDDNLRGKLYSITTTDTLNEVSLRLKASASGGITCLYADLSITGSPPTSNPTASPTDLDLEVVIWEDELKEDYDGWYENATGEGYADLYYEDMPKCPSSTHPLQCVTLQSSCCCCGSVSLEYTINVTGYNTLSLEYGIAARNSDNSTNTSCTVGYRSDILDSRRRLLSGFTEIESIDNGSIGTIQNATYSFADNDVESEITIILQATGFIECYFSDFVLNGFVTTPSPTAVPTTEPFPPQIDGTIQCDETKPITNTFGDTKYYNLTLDTVYTVTFTDCGSAIDPTLLVYDEFENWISESECPADYASGIDGNDCNVDVCESGNGYEETFDLNIGPGTFYVVIGAANYGAMDYPSNMTVSVSCQDTKSVDLWNDSMADADLLDRGWITNDSMQGSSLVLDMAQYCQSEESSICTVLKAPYEIQYKYSLDDDYYGLALTYSMVAGLWPSGNANTQCSISYFDYDSSAWLLIGRLNTTNSEAALAEIFSFPNTVSGSGYEVWIRLVAIGNDDQCWFQDLVLDGWISLETDSPTMYPTSPPTGAPLPSITNDCRYVEPINSIFSLSTAIPLDFCSYGRVGFTYDLSERYSCVNDTAVVHLVYNSSNCSNPNGATYLSKEVLSENEASFNCNASSTCNYVTFNGSTYCGDDGGPDDTSLDLFHSAYVSDVCIQYTNSNISTVTRCYDDRLEFEEYNDTATCSVFTGYAANITDGCTESDDFPSVGISDIPHRRRRRLGVSGVNVPDYFQGDECTINMIETTTPSPTEEEYPSPVDDMKCPWRWQEGHPYAVGQDICNVMPIDGDGANTTSIGYTYHCVGFGSIQYTAYQDALCTVVDNAVTYSYPDWCEGCGAVLANDTLFDCSNYMEYDATACNQLVVNRWSYCDGVTPSALRQSFTLLEGECFSLGSVPSNAPEDGNYGYQQLRCTPNEEDPTSCSAASIVYSTSDQCNVSEFHNIIYSGCNLTNRTSAEQGDEIYTFEYVAAATTMTMEPTLDPTEHPSLTPTKEPTESTTEGVEDTVYVMMQWIKPDVVFVPDPYGRFLAIMMIDISNAELLDIDPLSECEDCFEWEIATVSDLDGEVSEFTVIEADDYSTEFQFIYQFTNEDKKQIIAKMVINKLRDTKSGYCYDEEDAMSHIFAQNMSYAIRLSVTLPRIEESQDGETKVVAQSMEQMVEMNVLPSLQDGGYCAIQDLEALLPADKFYLECSLWIGSGSYLDYNALLDATPMSDTFMPSASNISGLAASGSVSITVLIRDDFGGITCYAINSTFKTVTEILADNSSNVTVDTITENIENVINTTAFGDDNAAAISVQSVTEDLFVSGNINQSEGQNIVTDIVDNLVSTSLVVDQNETVAASTILSEVATYTTLTSNPDLVALEGAGGQIVDIIPDLFGAMEDFSENPIADDLNDTLEGLEVTDRLESMAEQSLELFFNLEQTLDLEEDGETENVTTTKNAVAQSLADYDTYAATIALSASTAGEQFVYEKVVYGEDGEISNRKRVGGHKFVAEEYRNRSMLDQPSIMIGNEGITMPFEFTSNKSGEYDCTMSSSRSSRFRPKDRYKTKSGIVTVNVYESGSDRRRRRLQNDDDDETVAVVYSTSSCSPYLISIDILNDTVLADYNEEMNLDEIATFPSCRFWNQSDALWDPSGCFVFNISNVTVVCACTHLTTFGVSAEDFEPTANILAVRNLRDLTLDNLWEFPTVWIVFVSVLVLFIIIGVMNPNRGNENRNIVAYEDIIYDDVRKSKMGDHYEGQQVFVIQEYLPNQDQIGQGMYKMSKSRCCGMCYLNWRLFRINIRNDHTLLSVVQRTAGTNFSTRQRLACFFMYLSTIMVASAMFYGVEQRGFGDITASFLISLCSTAPVLATKQLFLKSKPNVIESERHDEEKALSQPVQEHNQQDSDSMSDFRDTDGGSPTTMTIATSTTRRGTMMSQMVRSKTLTNAIKTVQTLKMSTSISAINSALIKAQKNKSRVEKLALVENVRLVLYKSLYPLPRYCKKLAWIVLILWSLSCAFVAILYGLQFDLLYDEESEWLGECWQHFKQNVISRNLSEERIQELQDALSPDRPDNFPGVSTSSLSFLLSLGQSILLSLLLWQPLTIYMTTWLKLWMFTWNISMGMSPGKMKKLFRKCCGCADGESTTKDEQHLERQLSHEFYEGSQSVVAHRSRPLDLLGFLGNDHLFLKRICNVTPRAENEEERDGAYEEERDGGFVFVEQQRASIIENDSNGMQRISVVEGAEGDRNETNDVQTVEMIQIDSKPNDEEYEENMMKMIGGNTDDGDRGDSLQNIAVSESETNTV